MRTLSKTYEKCAIASTEKTPPWVSKHPRAATSSIDPNSLLVQRLTPPLATLVSRRLLSSREARGVDDLSSGVLAVYRPVRSIVAVGFAELGKPLDVALVGKCNLFGRQSSGVAADAARIRIRSIVQSVSRFRLVEGGSEDKVRRPCGERQSSANIPNAAGVGCFGQERRGALVLALVGWGLGTIED